MDVEAELKSLSAAFHDHGVDDAIRFKSIDDKQDDILAALNEQNRVMKEHMDKVEPYLQGAAGFGFLWKGLMAIGGLLVLWIEIKGLFGVR